MSCLPLSDVTNSTGIQNKYILITKLPSKKLLLRNKNYKPLIHLFLVSMFCLFALILGITKILVGLSDVY